MERSGATLRFRVIEAVRFVFVAVVGSQVEVVADLHLLGEHVEGVRLEERVPDLLDGVNVELLAEVVENAVRVGSVSTLLAERGDRGLVGGCADEYLIDILRR